MTKKEILLELQSIHSYMDAMSQLVGVGQLSDLIEKIEESEIKDGYAVLTTEKPQEEATGDLWNEVIDYYNEFTEDTTMKQMHDFFNMKYKITRK